MKEKNIEIVYYISSNSSEKADLIFQRLVELGYKWQNGSGLRYSRLFRDSSYFFMRPVEKRVSKTKSHVPTMPDIKYVLIEFGDLYTKKIG